MSQSKLIAFNEKLEALRAGEQDPLTDGDLHESQSTIPFDETHFAFEDVSFHHRTEKGIIPVFNSLTGAFPKGRNIAVLGHRGSGKSAIVQLIQGRRIPQRGRVVVNSKLSWPANTIQMFDQRLTPRQNAIFLSRVLDLRAPPVIAEVQRLGELTPQQMSEQMKSLNPALKRRIAMIFFSALDFDVNIIDDNYNPGAYGVKAGADAELKGILFGRDYVHMVNRTGVIQDNCNLVYILYLSRLYMFEDVARAIDLFEALPVPPIIGPMAKPTDEDEEDEEENAEVLV